MEISKTKSWIKNTLKRHQWYFDLTNLTRRAAMEPAVAKLRANPNWPHLPKRRPKRSELGASHPGGQSANFGE